DFNLFVTKQAKRPERVASPPVGLVAVKNTSGIRRDSVPTAKARKFFWENIIANQRVLEISTPIYVHRSGDMPCVIKQNILIRFDDADALVFEVFLQPIGFYQRLWVRVLRRMRSHKRKKFRQLFGASKRFCVATRSP